MSDKEKSLDDLLTIREYFMVAAQELQAGNQRIKELEKHIKRLEEEVQVLRLYGNKDCTAQADAALEAKEDKP